MVPGQILFGVVSLAVVSPMLPVAWSILAHVLVSRGPNIALELYGPSVAHTIHKHVVHHDLGHRSHAFVHECSKHQLQQVITSQPDELCTN